MNTVKVLYPDLLTENGEASEILSAGEDLNITVFQDQRSEVEVESGDGPVTITGSQLDDTITGGAGNDIISGGEGKDFISGGDGDDFLNVTSGDIISGGDGNDVFAFDLSQELTKNLPSITDLQSGDKFAITGAEDSSEAPVYDRKTGVVLLGEKQLVNIGKQDDPSKINIGVNGKDSEAPSQIDSGETTVYRFYDGTAGAHFYTVDEVEKEYVEEELDNYSFEGESYSTVDPITGNEMEQVYRFFNPTTGVHLYTTSEVERDSVRETLDNFTYEGVKFYAHESETEGSMPVYRFYEASLGVHFYTPNEAEKDSVMENLDNYTYEGIAYYADPLAGDIV